MNRIKFFRRQAGITQEELAKTIGVDAPRIHRYETGKINCPLEKRGKIASALGLDYKLIFPEDEV